MPSNEYIRDLENNRIFHSYGYDEGYKDGYKKGYEDGKMLDDIRAEIENLKYEADIIMYGIAIDDVLQIIDRHREEAET